MIIEQTKIPSILAWRFTIEFSYADLVSLDHKAVQARVDALGLEDGQKKTAITLMALIATLFQDESPCLGDGQPQEAVI